MSIIVTRSDIGVILSFTAKSPAGLPIDLNGATVKLELFNSCCNQVLNATCLVLSAAAGTCQYTTVNTDLDIPAGTYTGVLKMTYSASKVLTSSQFEIIIRDPCHIA